ncbi:MAG: ABC transporter substrate-binding protein [Chloroflexi bacterium]|nr:ABC transporter substrate-binding protein [Chloroflexota bacterium]
MQARAGRVPRAPGLVWLTLVALLSSACGGTAAPSSAGTAATSAAPASAGAPASEGPGGSQAPAGYTGPKVTLTYAHGFTGPDGPIMQVLVNTFKQSHPNIAIEASAVPWGDTFATLAERAAAGQAPDLVAVTEDQIGYFMASGALQDLTDDIAALGVKESEFFPNFVSVVKWKDRQYGLPFSSAAFVMYYNKKLMNTAGISAVPETHDDFLAAAKACTTDGAGKHPGDAGFDAASTATWGTVVPLPWVGGTVGYGLLRGADGDLVDTDLNASFNSAAGQKAAQFLLDLSKTDQVSPPAPTEEVEVGTFQSGKSCFDITGVWKLTDYRNALKADLGVAFQPELTGKQAAWGAAVFMTLPKQADGYDPNKRAAALEFSRWMAGHDAVLSWTESGALPVRPDVASDPAYASNIMAPVAASLDKIFIPAGWPWVSAVRTSWDAALERIMQQKEPVEQSLTDGVKEANDNITQQRAALGL